MDPGYCEGETCNRDGCAGIIKMRAPDNCSCHLSAPCAACTAPRCYCDTCEWDEGFDSPREVAKLSEEESAFWKAHREEWERIRSAPLDNTKISWRDEPHTHFTMIKKGVFPPGTTREQVRQVVDGTFGGRFEAFDEKRCTFEFIAYTD